MQNLSMNLKRLAFRSVLALLTFCTFLAFCANAHAENWSFKRSYFSHEIPQQVAQNYPRPESRSAYRRPYKVNRGVAVRGGYRYNRVFLRSGNSVDSTVLWEGWFGVQQP